MQGNGNEFKNHILLISHGSEYKECHNLCKWITREAAQQTICCGWIYAIESVDLSYEIHKGGGSAVERKRSGKWVIIWRYSIHCATGVRPLAFSYIYTPIASLKGQMQSCFYGMKIHLHGQTLHWSDQYYTAEWRPSRELLFFRLPVDGSNSRPCGEAATADCWSQTGKLELMCDCSLYCI